MINLLSSKSSRPVWRFSLLLGVCGSFWVPGNTAVFAAGAETARGASAAAVTSEPEAAYGVGDWPEKLGNHRARLHVSQKTSTAWARIPWRRRDSHPEAKALLVVDASTQQTVTNVLRININREFGDLLFETPTAPGDYFVYYLPYRTEGWWAFPSTVYLPVTNTASASWLQDQAPLAERIGAGQSVEIPKAGVTWFEAINEFHRFDPMEIPATTNEMRQLLSAHPGEAFLLFPEDRRFPMRMADCLPWRWIRKGPTSSFAGEASLGESYAFQIGVYAAGPDLEGLKVSTSDFAGPTGAVLPGSMVSCVNLGGTNWLGQSFSKAVRVPKGAVQPLWFRLEIPADAKPGNYRGSIKIAPANQAGKPVQVAITVRADKLAGGGENDLARHARLRWLDSTIGLDDEVCPPYPPLQINGTETTLLGRRVRLGSGGLPESLQSTYSRSVDRVDGPATELLAAPMEFAVVTADGRVNWQTEPVKSILRAPGAAAWETRRVSAGLELTCQAKLEGDGYIDYRVTLESRSQTTLSNLWLEVPLRRETARYLMGLGCKGGLRPKEWRWQWDVNRANSQVWIGDVNAGLSLKLKHQTSRWDLYNLSESGPYRDWSNDGRGGCDVTERGDRVVIRAYTGPREISPGAVLHFNFGLLVTPVKLLDRNHWNWRYYHHGSGKPVKEVAATGATLVNLHHGDALNPHINYPFLANDKLGAYVREAHALNLKVKLYYTVRELSSYCAEFWALRSLGNEVFTDGPGFKLADHFLANKPAGDLPKTGSAWLCEHAISGYVPAWHQPLGNGHYDAAIATTGLSRWHNYYLEGLRWLVQNVGIDGLYLDGVGYDREIMKRVRKVMQRTKPGCLIDFHSGNNFHPEYGLNNCANQYMELFPYVDSIWFGEGFDYNESPDYWLVEISGLPYGLFGEMLQNGGNPWRGMIYGMSNRLGWGGDPRPLWNLWDQFGIQEARMIGYWDEANPVRTSQPDVLVTTYLKADRALLALASWAQAPARVQLSVDEAKLRFKNKRMTAPEIAGLQTNRVFTASETIEVAPGKGCLLILE